MATQEFQYIGDILKEWYAPAIVNQVYVKSPVWSQVKKTSKGVDGKRVYIPLRHTLSEAVGSLKANEYTLPTASKIGYSSTYIWQKRNYGRVQVDGLAIAASKGKGGWIDAFTGETRGIAESFAIEIDQQVMGRGTSVLGHATGDFNAGSVGTEAVSVDNPHGITELTPGYGWIRPGMQIAFWNYDAASELTSTAYAGVYNPYYQVASVDYDNNIVTFTSGAAADTSDAVVDGDYLIRRGSDDYSLTSAITTSDEDSISTGVGAIMGIDRIIDDDDATVLGTVAAPLTADTVKFQGIDGSLAASNWWRAKVNTSRGILTEMKIQEDLDSIEQNTDGEAPNLALTTYALRNKLIELVKSDYMLTTLNLIGGWEAIKYRGGSVSLPIMVHKYCPTGYWYYLNLKYLKFYTLKKLIWDSSMGGVIKQVASEDQFEAWFKMYGNLGTDKRNALGKSTGYTTS